MRHRLPYARHPMDATINSPTTVLDRLETTGEIRFRLQPRVFIPARLRAARRAAGVLQREMAAALDRDLRHYQRLESGEVNPTAGQLGQIAVLLDVTIDSLYAIPEEEARAPGKG